MRARVKYGDGVTSLPFRVRLALTVPVAAFGMLLLRGLYITTTSAEDARPAALVLVMLGVFGAMSYPVMRSLWHPTAEWRYAQARAAAEDRRRNEPPKAPHLNPFDGSGPAG